MELYGLREIERCASVRAVESGAAAHPSQPNAGVLDGLPFYTPRHTGDHVSTLSFNNTSLPDVLVDALISHPELFPDNVGIRWTQEQELILETTLGVLRERFPWTGT